MSRTATLTAQTTLVASAEGGWHVDRRDFLKASAWSLFGLLAGRCATPPLRLSAPQRFGLITDPHYADAPSTSTRYFRESLDKVREGVDRLRMERVGFLAILGDMKDMVPGEADSRTLSYLMTIEREFQRFGGPVYHVLGNHDLDNLSKAQVMSHVENTGVPGDRGYYAFSHGGLRIIVLDANYDQHGRDYDHNTLDWRDPNVPAQQLEWLKQELRAAAEPVIVFVHQRLDGDGVTSIRNRVEVREQLELSHKVLAVFQGHDHPGFYTLINGIHYYTLRAVVEGPGFENNAYAVVEVRPDLNIAVTGYRRAVGLQLPHTSA
jgi:hypothetical protein